VVYSAERALELLRLGTGCRQAAFRDQQEDAIRYVVENDGGRLLVVQRTGWGKSFVYFIAARLLRDQGWGPALIVSPLIALMRNQIDAATRMGLRAEMLNSSNRSEWGTIEESLERDELDALLVAPERFSNERFLNDVFPAIAERSGLLVIDEAHCISDWGHDFRPDYRRIEYALEVFPPELRVLGTTATATRRVERDLEQLLGPGLHTIRGDLHRPSLALQTIELPSEAERLAWLASELPRLPGHGVIYALTVRDAELITSWLQSRGNNVLTYTRRSDDREAIERLLITNRVKALVATKALGMGFDKPDVAFVIHYPESVTTYYQQVGRAGRALSETRGILLWGEKDEEIVEHFISSASPSAGEVHEILSALDDAPDGLKKGELLREVNIEWSRIEKILKLLALEEPPRAFKEDSYWYRGEGTPGVEFWERAKQLKNLRLDELEEMRQYTRLEAGHMEFLIEALDGDPSGVESPSLEPLAADVPKEVMQEAIAFLREPHEVAPRAKWPDYGMPRYDVRGIIDESLRAQPGRALCRWGDGRWSPLVREGKYESGHFSDELVEACCTLLEKWGPDPFPTWVTCIPSRRHPELVPDFAARLAGALGLAFDPCLVKVADAAEQKSMRNSARQALNLDGTLDVADWDLDPGPVLLVDDMVDSGWTFTIAAWLLRSHGAGPVWPLALAKTSTGG